VETRGADQPSKPRLVAAVASVLLVLVCFATSWTFNSTLGLSVEEGEFNLPAWEIRNFPQKWLFALRQLLRGDLSETEQDAIIARFFRLTDEIEALEQEPDAAAAELTAKRKERDRIENQVEATLEQRLSEVIEAEGLTRTFLDFVWPPVDFEFAQSPRVLAVSPRDHIELIDTDVLKPGLGLETVTRIEEERERDGSVSAISLPTSGFSAYPTIVTPNDDYRRVLEVAAHEWVHTYLFFYPLGFNYYASNDLRALNETVAERLGRELSGLVAERWPLSEGEPASTQPRPEGDLDVTAQLRALRAEVDELLAQGEVEAAEALMERRRQELAAQGAFFRKLNQAYFAFINLYAGEAGNPAATNPVGPKVDELRRRSPSLQAFVATVRDLTSIAQLDAALRDAPLP
jgi:hypothetical protein